MTITTNMTVKEIINDFKEKYYKVRKLIDEDSKNDPENDPYLSKYKAKEILLNMLETLKLSGTLDTGNVETTVLDAMKGTILLTVGVIDMETEDITNSEKLLVAALDLLLPSASKPEIVIIMINVYNNLGVLWSNRDEAIKAKGYLLQAKELYETFKCTLQMPLSIEHLINSTGDTDVADFIILEKAYTLTLYYLAQVFGSLKGNLKSAIYCHVTLRRQLQYNDYEPIDWSLNSATLSQFFAEQDGFFQSRHHLAAASKILELYEEKLQGIDNSDEINLAKLETFKHRSADVARCWVKYCILLMSASRTRLMSDAETAIEAITDLSNLTIEDDENICGGSMANLVFPDLDVSTYESKVIDKYLLTYQDSRQVFQCCQEWLNKAKEYYKPDTHASDYVQLVQDSSESYTLLAFFEEDDERRAKMHKRRIDMLEDLIKELNPLYYLHYCRQLWLELGSAYSDILDIKLDKLNKSKDRPTAHALNKINNLCEKSIEHYDNFLNSFKDKKGVMPAKIEFEMIKPVVSAFAYIGRNSMKRIALDKSTQLAHVTKSYDSYQAVVDICSKDEDAAAMMQEEYSLCKEMVRALPIKIKRIQSEVFNSQ